MISDSTSVPFIRAGLKHEKRNTHRVVFFNVATDVQQQFVADVDTALKKTTGTVRVTASHQTGLHLVTLKQKT